MTPSQIKFAQWLATPKSLRVPKTQEELAVALNVSERTLLRWKTDELWAEVDTIIGDQIHTALASIITTQIDIATDTDNPRAVNAAKLLIEHLALSRKTAPKETPIDQEAALQKAKEELTQWMSDRQ